MKTEKYKDNNMQFCSYLGFTHVEGTAGQFYIDADHEVLNFINKPHYKLIPGDFDKNGFDNDQAVIDVEHLDFSSNKRLLKYLSEKMITSKGFTAYCERPYSKHYVFPVNRSNYYTAIDQVNFEHRLYFDSLINIDNDDLCFSDVREASDKVLCEKLPLHWMAMQPHTQSAFLKEHSKSADESLSANDIWTDIMDEAMLIASMKPDDETEYFIFGSDACEIYNDGGLEALLKLLDKPSGIDFRACRFNPGVLPSQVIEYACGYMGEAEVTAGDFESISQFIPSCDHMGVICDVRPKGEDDE